MNPLSAFAAALVVSGSLVEPVSDLAVQVVGRWSVDLEAARAEVARALEQEIAVLAEPERSEVREAVMLSLERTLREVGSGIELRPGGAAVIQEPGGTAAARWTAEEEFVRIEKARPGPGEVPLLGMIEGDTLWIEPDDTAQDALPIPLKRE